MRKPGPQLAEITWSVSFQVSDFPPFGQDYMDEKEILAAMVKQDNLPPGLNIRFLRANRIEEAREP